MPSLLLQDVIVAAVALGATGVLTRRVLGFLSVGQRPKAGCDKCASGRPAGDHRGDHSRDSAGVTIHPVKLIRQARR
ncbi:MAG: hypothetical protein AB7N65_18350 [Vicinamibacterales bacterium]